MKKIVSIIFLVILTITGCGTSEIPVATDDISLTENDIQNASSCWLGLYNQNIGDWIGDGQCTALARMLTTAPGYGKGADKIFLGGYDYVLQQQNRGVHIPLLVEVKDYLKPCDNLILIGPGFVAAGHTVVVFFPDLENDKIYYLDQNYNGEGVTLRQLSITKYENSAYVITAECKKPIIQVSEWKQNDQCQSFISNGPIIAIPYDPLSPSIGITIEAATESPLESDQILDGDIAFKGTDLFGNEIDIRLIRSDGSNVITIPLDNYFPDEYIPSYGGLKFSPDGKFIAFGRSIYTNIELDNTSYGIDSIKIATGPNELVVVELSSRKILTLIDSFESLINWSKDSSIIFHNRRFEWSSNSFIPIKNEGLWKTNIYSGEDTVFIPPINDNPISDAKWSPDGNYIAFHESAYEGYGPFGIMNSDGSNIKYWNYSVGNFDWSPDGKEIVFDERQYTLRIGMSLYIANPDGSNKRIFFNYPDFAATNPKWSPDGHFIAFLMTDEYDSSNLWVIERSGNNLSQLTGKDLESISDMSWSPDSYKLLTSAKNGFEMYIISLSGENFYLGPGLSPVWKP